MASRLGERPQKVKLVSYFDGKQIPVLVHSNPETFSRSRSANYKEPEVNGMTFQDMQYSSTKNGELKMTFHMDKIHLEQRKKVGEEVDLLEMVAFLDAHLFPQGGGSVGTKRSAPPDLLIVWPNCISIRTKLINLNITYQRFALDGTPTYIVADCSFKERHFKRRTHEQVKSERLG